jgi:hypothetical protein
VEAILELVRGRTGAHSADAAGATPR